LNKEWVKLELIISAVRADEGNRGRRTRLNTARLISKGLNLPAERVEYITVALDAFGYGPFQM